MSDSMKVVEAARDYRTAVRRVMTQGRLPARRARQELFDALDQYDGKPTQKEQAVLDDAAIAASIERHLAKAAKAKEE